MRIWDLNPGYLNRQSLLGEHRELHGIVSILIHNKKGYSLHPETLRWVNFGWALTQRHKMLVAEMQLRGYKDKSPVELTENDHKWPINFIDDPYTQIKILKQKYENRSAGRIPLPKNAQEFWAQHKYSVMVRDLEAYKQIGKFVASKTGLNSFESLAKDITDIIRNPPENRFIENTLLHLWGYVSNISKVSGKELDKMSMKHLFLLIQKLSLKNNVTYLIHSTILSELNSWDVL